MDSIPSVRRARGFERANARARARAREECRRARVATSTIAGSTDIVIFLHLYCF